MDRRNRMTVRDKLNIWLMFLVNVSVAGTMMPAEEEVVQCAVAYQIGSGGKAETPKPVSAAPHVS
jgi:hypothetical protein